MLAVRPAAASTPSALTTRFLDFWLLGGASLLVWFVMFAAQPFRASWAVDQHFRNLAVTTLSLSLLVNYPHFLMSYKLAYSRGPRFVLAHWWQLVAVPLGLMAMFAVAYAYYAVPVDSLAAVAVASDALAEWGVNGQVLARPQLGDLVLTAAFHLMIFTIGWHYTKQVFGCMMVYSHFDRYPLDLAQRTLIKYSLFSIWAMSFVDFNIAGQWRLFSSFTYSSFDLPDWASPLSQALVIAAFGLVAHRVFYANYRETGRRPSVNMVVPFVALAVWWLPLTRQQEFFFLLAPLFHSLQYLAFVYRMEDTRLRGARNREAWGTALIVAVVIAGWLAFEFVPNTIDTRLATFDAWGVYFFFTAATLFINIHHYFIDNVIWRFKDPEVREYLLS